MRGCGDNASGSIRPEGGECVVNRSDLGWSAVDGESPVGENMCSVVMVSPSSSGPVESAVNLPGPPGKPEYFSMTDSGLVP